MPDIAFRFYVSNQNAGLITARGRHVISISMAHLVLAAMTVGRPSWSAVLQNGRYSAFECVWRAAMVLSNVAVVYGNNGSSHFAASQAFLQLDPSEKAASTFFIAGAMTKIVSEQFGIPTLYHLDTLGQQAAFHGPNLPVVAMLANGNRRPDFIGPNAANRYGVFESKGRSHNSDNTLRLSAKEQTTMINTINGHNPFCRVACITNFGGDMLTVDVVDPTEPHKEAFSMDTKDADFKEPFRLATSLLHEDANVFRTVLNDEPFRVAKLEEADIEFGLREDILRVVENGSNEEMRDKITARGFSTDIPFPESVIEGLMRNRDSETFIGLDGHYIKLGPSWKKLLKI